VVVASGGPLAHQERGPTGPVHHSCGLKPRPIVQVSSKDAPMDIAAAYLVPSRVVTRHHCPHRSCAG